MPLRSTASRAYEMAVVPIPAPQSPGPPIVAAIERLPTSPASASTLSISSHVSSGSFAPYCDDVTLATITGSIRIASIADNNATLSPGKEPVQPTATLSPG